MNLLRIGLSTRIITDNETQEKRDALSQDWYPFLHSALPGAEWILLPNSGKKIIPYIRNLGINGFILTGGNDLGTEPDRDVTEFAVLELAIKYNFPLFGVCRGLQVINAFFGGELVDCTENHSGKRHVVTLDKTISSAITQEKRQVNSFHKFGVSKKDPPVTIIPFAESPDGIIEGLMVPKTRVTAVMWHPERESQYSSEDLCLIRYCFSK